MTPINTISPETGKTADTFPQPYRITLKRERNPAVGDSVTFILIANGRPRPLADGGTVILEEDKKQIEIPVFITKNSRKKFEGVLTGTADGRDVRILWTSDPGSETLGHILETTNDTLVFRRKRGATRW